MKNIFVISAIAATILTACAQTHFGAAQDSSSAASQSDLGANGKNPDTPNTQPADPTSGGQCTYEQSQCKWATSFSFLFTDVSDGAQISNLTGNLLIKGNHVADVTGLTGNLIFLGTTDTAKIDHIGGLTGNVIVCHADIGILDQDSFGNVVVVGGSVDQVKDFTGNLLSVSN